MRRGPTTAKPARPLATSLGQRSYEDMLSGVVELLDAARRAAARSVNTLMTATYWEIGRRIVEHEQGGRRRAGYGEELIERLSVDLTARFGRGFGRRNLFLMRSFFLAFREKVQTLSALSPAAIHSTPSSKSPSPISQVLSEKSATPSRILWLADLAHTFPLPWSHYVLLISRTWSPEALEFYHTEALRGGWSVRQLARQIGSQFYERTALSKNKAAMLTKGARTKPEDAVTADEEIRDPLVLEFLNLKDEYSEHDLEEALIQHLETFLLELGGDFAFVGRQRRLRIDDEWYRVDLVFFHRVLRCLVIIDLKLERFTHAEQMHLYLNYASAHWTRPGENPPVG